MHTREGQGVIEYVLLAALVIIVLIAGANLGKNAFENHFNIAANENYKGGGMPAH